MDQWGWNTTGVTEVEETTEAMEVEETIRATEVEMTTRAMEEGKQHGLRMSGAAGTLLSTQIQS